MIKEESVPGEDIIYNTQGQHTYPPLLYVSLLGSNRTLTTRPPSDRLGMDTASVVVHNRE